MSRLYHFINGWEGSSSSNAVPTLKMVGCVSWGEGNPRMHCNIL